MRHDLLEGVISTIFSYMLFGGLTTAWVFRMITAQEGVIIFLIALGVIFLCTVTNHGDGHYGRGEK